MRFFKRQFPDPASQPDDAWVVAQGEHDGDSLLVRLNSWAARLRGHPEYQHQVGVAIPLTNQPGLPQLPSEPTLDRVNEFEDELIPALSAAHESILVAVLTLPRMREFVLYTKNPAAAKAKLEAIAANTKDLLVQFIVQHDPKWNVYESYMVG